MSRLLRHVAVSPGRRPVDVVTADERDVEPERDAEATSAEMPTVAGDRDTGALSEPMRSRITGRASDRYAALDLIREARHWFEQHEPSSPIPVLLRRAEQFVGKRYADVVSAIPAELLAQWESAKDDD